MTTTERAGTDRARTKHALLAAAKSLGTALALVAGTALAQGGPVKVGGTLALTGPLAGTGVVHRIASDIAVEGINKRGGLMGRQIDWVLKDDQSRADLARTLYEQLVTVDKVDLLMGPYGTQAILSAMGVAQRYNKVLPHNTFGLPALAKYDMQFSVGGQAFDIENVWPNLVFDAVASAPRPPKTVAIVSSKFPSVHFVSNGAREAAKKRGIKEIIWLDWDFGNRDFGAIATRLKEANAEFLWVGAVGLEGNLLIDAMKKVDYRPALQFHMFPAPGPMSKSPDGRGVMALTTFEEHAPFTNNPVAAEFVKTYNERATKAGLPDTSVELMAAVNFASWQALEAAVNATRSLDDKAIAAWLRANRVNTIIGPVRWDGPNNFMKGTDLYKVKQVQDGKWTVVWPKEFAAPNARILQ